MLAQVTFIGGKTVAALEGLGRFTRFAGVALAWLWRSPGRWARLRLLAPQLYQVGTKSLPVVGLVGLFIGAVLAVETFEPFRNIGFENKLGGVIDLSVVKQIGPVLAAVMIAGRVGGAFAAELGTMKVTEQIDALTVMGADPIGYLVCPRLVACLVMVPLLTIASDLMGILGGHLVTVQGFGVNAHDYWRNSQIAVDGFDVMVGLIKSVFFGGTIGLIACYKGFNCRPGAAGVGRATTDSFVVSFVLIIVENFFLAAFLKELYHVIYGYTGSSAL